MFEFYNIESFTGESGGWLQALLGGLIGALISAGIAWYISIRNIRDQRALDQERRDHTKLEQKAKDIENLSDQLDHFIDLFKSVLEKKLEIYEEYERKARKT